jgi:3-phenylpropionate/trans-cinnamate dioxygenase ferredoxin subunit
MTDFVRVASVADLPSGQRLLIDIDDLTVAVFNVEGDYYCIEDVCTHDDGPVAEGALDGFSIECPRHGALFDIRDGSVLSMPAVVPVPTYEVRIEGDDILVEKPNDW